jgi:hypothetical protein
MNDSVFDKVQFQRAQSLVSSFISNLCHFKMCQHSILFTSDYVDVSYFFPFAFIYLVQAL